MSTCLQVKDKKYFAVLGYMSVIVIWHFLIELARGGGGVFSSIFCIPQPRPQGFSLKKGKREKPWGRGCVYRCHGLSRPPVEVVGFAHLAKQTHEGGLGRKQ